MTVILYLSKLDFVATGGNRVSQIYLFFLQEVMNENKDDAEIYLQYNVDKFEGKPNLNEMSAGNIGSGTKSSDNRPVTQTSNGSRDMESSEIDQSVQNLGVQIKEEPDTNDTGCNSSCDTGLFWQLYDHSSDNAEMRGPKCTQRSQFCI